VLNNDVERAAKFPQSGCCILLAGFILSKMDVDTSRKRETENSTFLNTVEYSGGEAHEMHGDGWPREFRAWCLVPGA
jgi:hypothetical protein